MCGVFGSFSPGKPIDQSSVRSALATLAHRGPNGKDFWMSQSADAALGHTRLSIIDLQGGRQPIANEDNTIFIVVNGELYQHEEIRKDLELRGHVFRTRSDSEIALHLYEEYGLDFVSYLRGEFAIVLFDTNINELIAVRDRFGIKPLCYHVDQAGIVVASEAKAIFKTGLKAEWDYEAYHHALCFQYLPTNRTLFKGVAQVEPGEVLRFNGSQLKKFKYWDMNYPTEDALNPIAEEEAREELRRILTESVALRLRADVDICCHLSGGLDSSVIAGIITKLSGKAANCFTVSFTDASYDELSFAEETAQFLGASLTKVEVAHADMLENLESACYFSEGLAINGHYSAKYLLNRSIQSSGYKVALSGEGADEVLLGYPHQRHELDYLAEDCLQSNSLSDGIMLAGREQSDVAVFKDIFGYTPNFAQAKWDFGNRLQGFLSREFAPSFSEESLKNSLARLPMHQLAGRSKVHQSSYIWSKFALSNYILRTLGDGMEMAHSVEGRLPFLDHKLVEFCNSLPLKLKVNPAGVEKYLLREACKDLITPTIYNRRKHPFIAPPVKSVSNLGNSKVLKEVLSEIKQSSTQFFDATKVTNLVERFPHLPAAEQRKLDPVLMTILSTHFLQKRYSL